MSDQPAGLLQALVELQGSLTTLPKDATNPHFSSAYTPLDTIVENVAPKLHEHGLAWITMPGGTHDAPVLTYRLVHAATGEALEGTVPLLVDKSSMQAFGSAITYARRYALSSVLNLVSDEDDDGNRAGQRQQRRTASPDRPSPAQKTRITELLQQNKLNKGGLQIVLNRLGIAVPVEDGWMDKLTPGRDGTASALITHLIENPTPSESHPSDAPADERDFEVPEERPMELLGE